MHRYSASVRSTWPGPFISRATAATRPLRIVSWVRVGWLAHPSKTDRALFAEILSNAINFTDGGFKP